MAQQGWGPTCRLSFAERLELQRRVGDGERFEDVAASVGCSTKSIQRLLARTGGIRPRVTERSARRLSLGEREEISRGLGVGESARRIARRLCRAPSTITREVAAGGGRANYRAWYAEEASHACARRPKAPKLVTCSRLRAEVERRLAERWSPQQISGRLVVDYPCDPEMRVSHETIYQSLFVQARGALRKELTAHLRTGRTRRQPHRRTNPGGELLDMVLLADRPAEANDRAVPGHWEGDLIIGKKGLSAVATLVERHSRFVMLVHLFDGRSAPLVRQALTAHFSICHPSSPVLSPGTSGKEMAQHVGFTIDTGMQVYFCDPHSPPLSGQLVNGVTTIRQVRYPISAILRSVDGTDDAWRQTVVQIR